MITRRQAVLSLALAAGMGSAVSATARIMTKPVASTFHYIIFIRATPERVWAALLDPNIERRCWRGPSFVTDWKPSGLWRMVYPDGRTANSGKILEIEPPNRLVLSWRNEAHPERAAEGYSNAVLELCGLDGVTKFSVTHVMDRPNSTLIAAASESWPLILSNLKSLLETGEVALK